MGLVARAPAFVGDDRRRAPAPAGAAWGTARAAAAVLVTAAVLAVFAAAGDPLGPQHAVNLRLVLDTAAVVVALGLFALCAVRRHLTGEAPPLWVGTAAAVYGLVALGLAGIGPALGLDATAVTAAGRAALVTTLALLAGGVAAPAVDTRVRPGRLAAGAAFFTAALTASFTAVPGLGRALTVAGVEAGGALTAMVASMVVVAWLVVAGAWLARGIGRARASAWCGALAFALLLAQLADTPVSAAATAGDANRWAVAAAVLRLVGFVVAAAGCGYELARAWADQRSRLFDSQLTLETVAVSDRLEKASRRAQRHDVRNAVVAIEGAAMTLERYRERLSSDDRTSLTRVLSSGVARLQSLMGDGRAPGTVELAATVDAVVADLGWTARVVNTVPPELAGRGEPTQTAEVVRLLLDNADKRAPGAPITVDGRVDGTWAVVRVADSGPPVPLEGRRSLNARFDAPAAGSGDIGVLVAGRLMRSLGGDLWMEESATGGAFAVCLPLPAVTADGA